MVLTFISYHFNDMQLLHELSRIFYKIDRNTDGKITKEDLWNAYEEAGEKITKSELEEIINMVDFDKNGFIEYEEFIRVCIPEDRLFTDTNLKHAFDLFDTEKKGAITHMQVVDALEREAKINPKMIKFEITESKDIKYTSNFVEMVNRLIEVGFDFILDDYGTGYSNLERFAKLPIDYVKVDRSIVRLATINNMDDALKSTFNMIHELGRKSFIEGIETEDEYNEFLKYKCHYIQGNYLCPALKEDEFFEFIKEKNINK